MGKIGIIANPTSGKDIRRLVGQALVIGNREKINIVKRVLIGAGMMNVHEFLIMPDRFRIGEQCIHDLKPQFPELAQKIAIANLRIEDAANDSIKAAELMREWGADCIITLGGDGTVRVVDKGAGKTPILPISTGTNNVIPYFIEGTIAGMAAGMFSCKTDAQKNKFTDQQKRLEIFRNGQKIDSALVDIAVIEGLHVGSRAVWDPYQILQVFVTRASPMAIGISSIIGRYRSIAWDAPFGASAEINEKGSCYQVQAILGPGMIFNVCVGDFREIYPDEIVEVKWDRPIVLALDGEREIELLADEPVLVKITTDGPYFVNYNRVLENP